MYDLNLISPVCADAQSVERAHKRVACSDTLLTKRAGSLPLTSGIGGLTLTFSGS